MQTAVSRVSRTDQGGTVDLYEIRQVRMPDGEILYLLADRKTGLPDSYVIRFTYAVVRPAGVSPGTHKAKLRGIRIGLTYLRERSIDIEERIGTGRFLDNEELGAIRERCLSRANGSGRISGRAASHFYSTFVDYFAFRTDEVVQYAPKRDHAMIAAARADFLKRAERHRPRGADGVQPNERLGLEHAARELLLRIIRPGDPGNPFHRSLQVRNHAIILLTYALGLRSGEEFSLKRADYDDRSSDATITIHRRPDDPDERRADPALVKTHGRTLPVDGDVRATLDAWLSERRDRARYPNARRHPYIFVSRTGDPISLRRGRQIYETLRRVHPEIGALMQHVIRHDANDRWTEEDEETSADPNQSRRNRLYAFGWSENSKMPELYGKAATRRSTEKRIADAQRKAARGEES